MEGIGYDQTFSPTVRFESIRQLVAMGASKGMKMYQMDVTNAFLYAPLEEVVYVEQPEGTVGEGNFRVKAYVSCMGQSEIDERTSDEV